jgi:hypothetical protein
VIDGLVITGANNVDSAPPAFCAMHLSGDTTVRDCRFEGNIGAVSGGLCAGGVVDRCSFVGNVGSSGGGYAGGGEVTSCRFFDNRAGEGGGAQASGGRVVS